MYNRRLTVKSKSWVLCKKDAVFEASLTFQTPTAFWSLPLLYLHTRPTHHTAMLFQSCKNIFSYVASQVQPYIPAPLQNILPSLGFSSHQQLEQARRYACGILTSMSLDEDHWQVVDFVALRRMLGCPDENSFWLCAEEIFKACILLEYTR